MRPMTQPKKRPLVLPIIPPPRLVRDAEAGKWLKDLFGLPPFAVHTRARRLTRAPVASRNSMQGRSGQDRCGQ